MRNEKGQTASETLQKNFVRLSDELLDDRKVVARLKDDQDDD